MLPLLDSDRETAIDLATTALERFATLFNRHWLDGMRAKLGLFTEEEDDAALVNELLRWMRRTGADFTNTFRMLSTSSLTEDGALSDEEVAAWRRKLEARLQRQPQPPDEVRMRMRAHNPAVIARNHKVEEALAAATERGDFSVTERLLAVLATPYDHTRDLPAFSAPPSAGGPAYRTFCGT
jgi:uncharacterized protein YdiU (UPF0061 family)